MKKMKWVLGIGLCVLIIGAACLYVSIQNMSKIELNEHFVENSTADISADEEYYLMAEADSEEEAKEIAELYDITFEKYLNGIGRYSTMKNPVELFEMGNENGYPALELSQKMEKYQKEGE